jgi:hypothetical protein
MTRLPPAEKLPLALRKNVRDEWENNKEGLESELSGHLGTAWTIDVNPLAIWPYHNDGYAKESLGNCIKGYVFVLVLTVSTSQANLTFPSYIEGAIYQLKQMVNKYGDDFKNEINAICSAHVLTLDLEETSPARFSYGGCDVADGKLRVLFVESNLGTNVDYCCEAATLVKALNAAPSDAPMSYVVRAGIREDYDPKIAEVRQLVAQMLEKPEDAVTLNPNFEANFAKMAASSGNSSVRDDWQSNLANFTYRYFDALRYHMKNMKVAEDEMVREGLLEAVSTNEYVFRVVDKLSYASYCECVIEDGVLYLQCTPENFGTNLDDCAAKLMDQL